MSTKVYGIKTSRINRFEVHTIKVAFNFDLRTESLIRKSFLHSDYYKVMDKNGKEKLVIDFGTQDKNKFALAAKDFYKISFENALDNLIDEAFVSRDDINRILTSKLVYRV
jgi:hypothetical protein